MNIKWDADNYTTNFDFVHRYGQDVLALIDAPAGGYVVDLGCGNGALTKVLCDKGYRVTGLDASAEMLEKARAFYPELDFRPADATDFRLEEKADCIFSNAVFHWIDKTLWPRLARCIADNLKPGGTLVCEFGGYGCAETVHRCLEKVFANHGLSYRRTFNFARVGEFAPILEEAGLLVEYATLFDRPTLQKTEDGLANWIRMFNTRPFEGIDPALAEVLIDEAVELARPTLHTPEGWIVDYVRIRIKARKREVF